MSAPLITRRNTWLCTIDVSLGASTEFLRNFEAHGLERQHLAS